MATASIAYPAAVTLTITLTSLASSSTLLAGRESTAVDNSTELAVDYLVGGKITAGAGTPIAGVIEVWAYGTWDGTLFSGGCTGSDAALTFTNEKIQLIKLTDIVVNTTAAHTYEWGPKSIATAFGAVPKKWGIFVTHNSSAALHATASNHEIKATPIHFTSA